MTWSRPREKLRSPWVIVPVALAVTLSLGIFWFLQNYEKKTFEEVQGGSPAAWKDPLLAAGRYLQASGKNVFESRGISFLSTLPPPTGALVIYRLPRGLSRSVTNRLLTWVRAGGHLLFTPNPWTGKGQEDDGILSRLGVQIQKKTSAWKRPAGGGPQKAAGRHKKTDGNGYHPFDSIIETTIDGFAVRIKYFGASLLEDRNKSATFRINGSCRIHYRLAADERRKDNDTVKKKSGDWLLQYRVGAGKITVVSENSLFTNQAIGALDHAFLLTWLLRDDSTVRLLVSSEAKGLPAVLWDKMPLFWVSLSVLLALALWRLQKQSGTLLQVGADEQLNILAHIDAAGMFNWRTNRLSSILAANRKTLLLRWGERKSAAPDQQPGPTLLSTPAAGSGLAEKDLADAFRLRIQGEQDLIKTSRALQKIQGQLHGGESQPF